MFDHEVEKVIKRQSGLHMHDLDVNELYEQNSTSKYSLHIIFQMDDFYPYVRT